MPQMWIFYRKVSQSQITFGKKEQLLLKKAIVVINVTILHIITKVILNSQV